MKEISHRARYSKRAVRECIYSYVIKDNTSFVVVPSLSLSLSLSHYSIELINNRGEKRGARRENSFEKVVGE